MIVGTGIDITRISRFEEFLARREGRILDRLFTPGEHRYCAEKKSPARHFAARFAAKEAFLKAIGTGLRSGITWHDVEVVPDPLGKPGLVLHGEAKAAADRLGVAATHLSLSHDGDTAVAMVVLEAR